MRFPRRFSLRSILLLMLTGAAAVSVALKWEAWQQTAVLKPTELDVRMARFSPDGRYLVTQADRASKFPQTSNDRTTVWTRSGQEIFHADWCENLGIYSRSNADFKYGSRWLYMQYTHHTANAQLVDLTTRKMLFPEESVATSVSFSNDQRRCAVAFHDREFHYRVTVYDLETAKILREERAYFDARVGQLSSSQVRISGDGRRVMAFALQPDGNDFSTFLVFYDVETGMITRSRHVPDNARIDGVEFSEDGSRAILRYKNAIRILDVATDAIVFEQQDLSRLVVDAAAPDRPLNYLFYESNGETYCIETSAKVIQPARIAGASLANANVTGAWLAWRKNGKVSAQNVQTGSILNEFVILQGEAEDWTVKEFPNALLVCSRLAFESEFFNWELHYGFTSKHASIIPSPDGLRILQADPEATIHAVGFAGEIRGKIVGLAVPRGEANWSNASDAVILYGDGPEARVWSRVRDDTPGAFLLLPELWLAVAFICAFLFSVRSDLRRLRSPI